MTISSARPDDLPAAFNLLYGPHAAETHLAHAFQLVARGELDPGDVLVNRTDDRISGAVFCQRLPGAIAVIWPPRAVGDDPAIEDALSAAALGHVAGVKLVQTFLPPEEAGRAGPLLRAGFRRVARVWQMTRVAASGQVTRTALASRLTLVAYHGTDPAEFERTLLRAHDDSLDCPELHGVRTPDEVLAGYRDCAPDLSHWWLARFEDEPAGVLVLGPGDLTFVGVVPERRGHGVGRALVEAAVSWRSDLSLTVDDRNVPAIGLYQSVGFKPVGSRDVFVWVRSPRSGDAGVPSS